MNILSKIKPANRMAPTKEQIEQAYQEYQRQTVGLDVWEQGAFIAGAEWALSQNRWIPVEERLPETSTRTPDGFEKGVADVLVSNGELVYTDTFIIDIGVFYLFGESVKFWMPRPTPPQK